MVRHAIVQDQKVQRLQRRLVMMEVFERMVAQQRHHALPGRIRRSFQQKDARRMAEHEPGHPNLS